MKTTCNLELFLKIMNIIDNKICKINVNIYLAGGRPHCIMILNLIHDMTELTDDLPFFI